MNKKKLIPVATAVSPAKCEDCHHFTGSAFFWRFDCALGHRPDSHLALNRENCADRKLFTREEQIFRRYKHVPWSGGPALKNKKSAVLRTGTSLRKTLAEFEKVLSSEQAKAIRDAAAAFDQLGRDIDVAGEILQRYRESEGARLKRERIEKLDKIAAQYFGDADNDTILAVAQDLENFYSDHGLEWYRENRHRAANYYKDSSPIEKLREYRIKPNAQLLLEIRRKSAECFEAMGINGEYRPAFDPGMADFEAFRTWLREQNELMCRIATGKGIKTPPRRDND